MKAEIKKDGFIWITAEDATEAFALNHLVPVGDKAEVCKECNQVKIPVVIDASVLN
jgi:hypothetical protein